MSNFKEPTIEYDVAMSVIYSSAIYDKISEDFIGESLLMFMVCCKMRLISGKLCKWNCEHKAEIEESQTKKGLS